MGLDTFNKCLNGPVFVYIDSQKGKGFNFVVIEKYLNGQTRRKGND